MTTDNLCLIQEKLNKKLLNLNIENFDKQKYILLTRDIAYEVNIIIPALNLREDNIATEFSKKHLLIKSISSINSLSDCFCIYVEIENNIFRNIEVSFLC